MRDFKKYKLWIGTIFLVFAFAFLVACSQNDTGLVITNKSIEMNDNKFSGTETHTITLKANDRITLDTRGNVFNVNIIDESGTPMPFFGNSISGSNLSGQIIEDGEHTITIEGSGSFKVSWE